METGKIKITYRYGIGLYLVTDIIEEHQGTVWATSNPCKGSTFSFSIPAAL